MGIAVGVLCSGRGLELAALIQARAEGRLPADLRLAVCDSQNADVLNLARSAGIQAAVVPRGAYHANLEGYERRLLEMMRGAGVEMIVLAGFARELGGLLEAAYPGRMIGLGLGPLELAAETEKFLRKSLFTVLG